MIYLINPSEKGILDNAGDRMPIGLLNIAANLEKHGKKVRVFDMNHLPEEYLYDQFRRDKPEAVGVSVYTSPVFPEARKIAEQIRS